MPACRLGTPLVSRCQAERCRDVEDQATLRHKTLEVLADYVGDAEASKIMRERGSCEAVALWRCDSGRLPSKTHQAGADWPGKHSHRKVAVLLLNRSQVKPSLQDRRGSKCGSLWACLPKPLVARQLTWAAIWRMSTVVEAMRRRLEGCGATRASRHTAVVLARHHKELDALLGMLEWGDPQCQRKRGQDRPILPPHA